MLGQRKRFQTQLAFGFRAQVVARSLAKLSSSRHVHANEMPGVLSPSMAVDRHALSFPHIVHLGNHCLPPDLSIGGHDYIVSSPVSSILIFFPFTRFAAFFTWPKLVSSRSRLRIKNSGFRTTGPHNYRLIGPVPIPTTVTRGKYVSSEVVFTTSRSRAGL